MTPEGLQGRLVGFAVRVGKVIDALPDTRLGRHVAGQLVRCSTSAAPNYAEGCAAESRKDFIHKLSICLKELREAYVWLQLIVQAGLLPEHRLAALVDEANQLRNILAQSLITAKRKSPRPPP
jgi:four helix bundle protein